MLPTLQTNFSGRWISRIQCEDAQRLVDHARKEYREGCWRVVLRRRNPERVVENSRGVLRRAGITFWKGN